MGQPDRAMNGIVEKHRQTVRDGDAEQEARPVRNKRIAGWNRVCRGSGATAAILGGHDGDTRSMDVKVGFFVLDPWSG